jgi:hypothetical protein
MEFGRHQNGSWDTRGAPFFSLMMVGLVVAAILTPETKVDAIALQVGACQNWDKEAAEGITHLISDTSAAAELKLSEALAQLHRARVYCRGGTIAIARNDYASLHRNFPLMPGSIRREGRASPDQPTIRTSLPK